MIESFSHAMILMAKKSCSMYCSTSPTGQRCVLIVSLREVRLSKHVYRSFDSLQDLTVAKNNREMRFLKRRNGHTNGRTDRKTDGRTDGQTDGRTDGWTDGWTNGIFQHRFEFFSPYFQICTTRVKKYFFISV